MTVQPVLARARRASVLEVAAEVLVTRPTASLTDVARAAGIGRTTLHKQYATRDDLLVAVAHRALDLLHEAVAAAALPAGVDDPELVESALGRLVTSFVPLGPEIVYLTRQPSLDDVPEVMRRFRALDTPLAELVGHGQRIGLLRTDMPVRWMVSTLFAQTYVAWEGVAGGWIAPTDAPELVVRTLLDGVGGPICASRVAHDGRKHDDP